MSAAERTPADRGTEGGRCLWRASEIKVSVCLCADHFYVFAPLTLTTAFWVSDITDFTLKMGKQVPRGREVTALGLS